MSGDVFISHASGDRDVAETLCQALENRGLSCWIAARDVGPGENFQVSIVRAIRAATVMVLVFSAKSNNSDEIKKELVLAGQRRLTVIPVRVEDVAPDEAFAYELAIRQWIDLFADWEDAVQRLARQIETVVGTAPRPATPDDAEPQVRPAPQAGRGTTAASVAPARPSPRRTVAIAAAIAAGVVAIGGVGLLLGRGVPSAPAPTATPAGNPTRPDYGQTDTAPNAAAPARGGAAGGVGSGYRQPLAPELPNIAGTWRDNWGIVYQVTQQGGEFVFTAEGPSCRGHFRATGTGTVSGTTARSRYTSSIRSTGECETTISGSAMNSTCRDSLCGANDYRLQRQ